VEAAGQYSWRFRDTGDRARDVVFLNARHRLMWLARTRSSRNVFAFARETA